MIKFRFELRPLDEVSPWGGDQPTLRWFGLTDGPTTEYVEAVHALDRELMAAMERRVDELESRGGRPGVTIDLVDLRRDHQQRQHWFARNLHRTPVTDWDAVRRGARLLLPRGT